MNKTWTASILAALLPFSIWAADGSGDVSKTGQETMAEVARIDGQDGAGEIVPIDLDAASEAYDIVLPQQPVHMTADSLVVRSADGYIQGRGNVDLQQGMDELHTSYIEGSTNNQLYHTPGPAVYLTSENALSGTGIIYNSKDGDASMDTIEGFIGPGTYIRGTGAEMVDGVGYVKHGLITTPHAVAKTPDYYITGDDIRIYPGEKFTAENTKLWFKHVCLLTYGHYEGRLDSEDSETWMFTLLPRPTFNSDDGVGLRGHADIPLNQSGDLSFNMRYALTTKNGFKPTAKIEQRTNIGTFAFGYGSEESTDNDDNIWATKWPELEYFLPRIDLGNTGIYITGSANWGRWSEDGQETGSHRGFRTEITHRPLGLWNNADIRFFSGYRRDWYSVEDAERRDPYWGVVLNQNITDRLWTSVWYRKHNISGYTPYEFDTIDDPRQRGFSVGYVLTPRDTIIFSLAQNLDTDDISDRNFTWVRDLHSFIAIITYEQVDKEWDIKVIPKDFRF